MANKEIKITFETITPLYTGDAWQESKEVRASSLIGSLRFWFEVICYFGGICSEKDFDKKKGRFEKDIKNDEIKKRLLKYGTDFWGQIEALKELEIPLPAIIFGTTGWESLIEVKSIKYLEDYCFGNKLNLPDKFCIKKDESREIREGNECPKKDNKRDNKEYNNWSFFYFKTPYFWGKFEATFKVPEEIKETIFFPLLNFMDKYGYWGGSWNIGYGRLKVKEIEINDQVIERTDWQKNEFDFSKFKSSKENLKGNWNGNFNSLINTVNYNDLINKGVENKDVDKNIKIDENIDKMLNIILSKENKIIQIQIKKCNEINKEDIKELIDIKAKLRLREKYKLKAQNKNDEVKRRHEIFGYLKPTEGSKILPYINRLEDDTYECGLLSIAGILNLYQEPKNEQQ